MQKSTVVLIAVVIALAALVVWQQYQISQIRNEQSAAETDTGQTFDQAKAVRDSLLETKTVSGVIVSSTASQVVITAKLVDLAALNTFDFAKSQTLPASEKNLTIKITKDTAISGKPAAGSAVTVQTKEPVYEGGALTAISINVSVPPNR